MTTIFRGEILVIVSAIRNWYCVCVCIWDCSVPAQWARGDGNSWLFPRSDAKEDSQIQISRTTDQSNNISCFNVRVQ